VPTAGTDAEGNEEMSADDTHAIFDAIINDYPLPQENNSNGTANTPPAGTGVPGTQPDSELVDAVTAQPADVTVQVSNATSETGLAATAADQLQQRGFNVLNPDNYPDSLPATTVLFSPGNEGAAATVAGSLVNPQIQRVAGMGQTVQLVLGPDFNAVGAPPPTGSAVRVHVNQDLKVGSNAGPATGSVTSPPRLPDDLSVTNGADTSCK
jgi:hypothetical protein